MEAGFGIFRKIIAGLSVFVLLIVSFQTGTANVSAGEKLSFDIAWEKAESFDEIVGDIDGKMLVFTERYGNNNPCFKLVSIVDGTDCWEGIDNDLKKITAGEIDTISMEYQIRIYNEKILILLDNGLHCYNFFTGNQLWVAKDSKNWLPPRYFEGNHGFTFDYLDYVNKPKARVVELDVDNGDVISSFEFEPDDSFTFKMNMCTIMGKFGNEIIYHNHDEVYSLNLETGTIKLVYHGDPWLNYSNDNYYLHNNIAVANKSIYCKIPNDWTEISGTDVTTGKILWSHKASQGYKSFGKYLLFKYWNSCEDEPNPYLCLVDIETGKIINKLYGRFSHLTIDENTDIFINEDYYGAFINTGSKPMPETVISVFDIKTHNMAEFRTNQYIGDYFHISKDNSGASRLIVRSETINDSNRYDISCFRINDGSTADRKIETQWSKPLKLLAGWRTYVVAYDLDESDIIDNTYIIDTRTNIVEPSKSKLASFLVGKKISELEYTIAGRFFCVYQKSPKITSMQFYLLDNGDLAGDNKALKDCFLPSVYYDNLLLTSCFTGTHFKVVGTYRGRGLGWYHIIDQKKVFRVVAFNGDKIAIFDDKLSIFDAKTEKRLWTYEGSFADGFKPEDVKIVENTVLLNAKDTKSKDKTMILALDSRTGKVLWSDESDAGFKVDFEMVYYTKTVADKKEILSVVALTGKQVAKTSVKADGFKTLIPLMTKTVLLRNNNYGARVEYFDRALETVGSVDFEGKTILNAVGCSDLLIVQLKDMSTNSFLLENVSLKW